MHVGYVSTFEGQGLSDKGRLSASRQIDDIRLWYIPEEEKSMTDHIGLSCAGASRA